MGKLLVYYFAFPHYRAEILEELHCSKDIQVVIAGGTKGRGGVRTLTSREIEFLVELESYKFGPVSWQSGIVARALTEEFDVVILGPATLSLSTWAILLGRRVLGRSVYLWGQCGKPGDRTKKRYAQELMNRLATGLLVYGTGEASAAADLGTSPDNIHIVNNATHRNDRFMLPDIGVEAYRRLQQRTAEAIDEYRLTLTYVGRITETKQLPVLLDACRLLHRRYEHLCVRIIGGGSAENQIKTEYSDPFIEYLGWVYDGHELDEILRESTLVVSPHDMGLVAIDALRSGVPVLVPDNPRNGPEVEALTESVNAIRFSADDSNAIVDAVERWLRLVPQITESAYIQAREEALRTWSPKNVAARIMQAVNVSSR